MIKTIMALIFLVLVSGASQAASLTWTLEGVTFDDGGTAVGSFNYDADTGIFSNIEIDTFGSVEASYGTLFHTDHLVVQFIGVLTDTTITSTLLLALSSTLTNAGGTVDLDAVIELPSMPPARSGSVGYLSAPVVPIPATVWLFGSGLLGLIGVAWRRIGA
jgi:hypothetical protein